MSTVIRVCDVTFINNTSLFYREMGPGSIEGIIWLLKLEWWYRITIFSRDMAWNNRDSRVIAVMWRKVISFNTLPDELTVYYILSHRTYKLHTDCTQIAHRLHTYYKLHTDCILRLQRVTCNNNQIKITDKISRTYILLLCFSKVRCRNFIISPTHIDIHGSKSLLRI